MNLKFNVLMMSLLLCTFQVSMPCTSFVVVGNPVNSQPPILTKVRDTSYDVSMASRYTEDLRYIHNNGFAYIAVMYGQKNSAIGSRDFVSVGTNEKGLSVALNFATSQLSRIQSFYGSIAQRESNIVKNILESASSLDEAKIKIIEMYIQSLLVPCILTISDGNKGMIVEIAVDENKIIHYEFKTTDTTGYIFATNHFDTPLLDNPSYNLAITADSIDRHGRISQLLSQNARSSFDLSTALRFAKDYDHGEGGSIFRYSSRATYIVQTNFDKSILFVEFTNNAQRYNRAVIILDQDFWKMHKDNDVIIAVDKPYSPNFLIELTPNFGE